MCEINCLNSLPDLAIENGQKLERVNFKDQSYLGLKTRSRDATLSRHKGINIEELALQVKVSRRYCRVRIHGFQIWVFNP